jgi:hypothetical protein
MPVSLLREIFEYYNTGRISQQVVSNLAIMCNGANKQGQYLAMHEIATINAAHQLSMDNPGSEVRIENNTGVFYKQNDKTIYEMDIVVNDLTFYEVKPQGNSAKKQLENYSEFFDPGPKLIETPSDIPVVGDVKMNLTSPQDGVIWYDFGLNKKPRDVNPEMVSEAQRDLFYLLLGWFLWENMPDIRSGPGLEPMPESVYS